MSKFKVGDKAILTKYYSEFWPEGHEFEVTELVDGGTYLKGRIVGGGEGTITAAWCIPIESELERLVRVANEGLVALRKLAENDEARFAGGPRPGAKPSIYSLKEMFGHDRNIFTHINDGCPIVLTEKKPKFEPFTVGSGWQVKLEGAMLHIGCRQFNAAGFKTALRQLGYASISASKFDGAALGASRNGVVWKTYSLPWDDADKILAALEKAGIK